MQAGPGLETAAWFTVRTCPAIVSRPVRAAPVLGATWKATACVPTPTLVDGVSHAASVDTVQTHAEWVACTDAEPEPPAAEAPRVAGDKEYEQAPGWGAGG